MLLKLRYARNEDVQQIFNWRNDPWIVSLSSSQKIVSWEEHIQWFSKVINRNKHILLIIESHIGIEMGLVRFDRENEFQAVVTIYLLQPFVGKGLGILALKEAYCLAFEQWSDLNSIHAFIRSDNLRSIRAFSKVGFQSIAENNIQDSQQVEMVLLRRTAKCQGRF